LPHDCSIGPPRRHSDAYGGRCGTGTPSSTACLQRAEEGGVPYAVVGGNAVAAWVATVDEAAVRNTRDVDILIRREDLDRARAALEGAGFIYRRVGGFDIFLEDAGASVRQAVHLVFSGEMVRPDEPAANP